MTDIFLFDSIRFDSHFAVSNLPYLIQMLGGSISSGRTNVRVVVVGDRATGKSSLITAAASETFPEEVPPVLPPTRLPADLYPDNVPVTIIDTSSRFVLCILDFEELICCLHVINVLMYVMICSLESRGKVAEELKRADAVVLTYACDQPSTLNRLTTFWLYEFRRLEVSNFVCLTFIVNIVKLKNIFVHSSIIFFFDIFKSNKKFEYLPIGMVKHTFKNIGQNLLIPE